MHCKFAVLVLCSAPNCTLPGGSLSPPLLRRRASSRVRALGSASCLSVASRRCEPRRTQSQSQRRLAHFAKPTPLANDALVYSCVYLPRGATRASPRVPLVTCIARLILFFFFIFFFYMYYYNSRRVFHILQASLSNFLRTSAGLFVHMNARASFMFICRVSKDILC